MSEDSEVIGLLGRPMRPFRLQSGISGASLRLVGAPLEALGFGGVPVEGL